MMKRIAPGSPENKKQINPVAETRYSADDEHRHLSMTNNA
jgi:hypothetical protein